MQLLVRTMEPRIQLSLSLLQHYRSNDLWILIVMFVYADLGLLVMEYRLNTAGRAAFIDQV